MYRCVRGKRKKKKKAHYTLDKSWKIPHPLVQWKKNAKNIENVKKGIEIEDEEGEKRIVAQ